MTCEYELCCFKHGARELKRGYLSLGIQKLLLLSLHTWYLWKMYQKTWTVTFFQIKSNTPVAVATPLLNQEAAKGSSKSQ